MATNRTDTVGGVWADGAPDPPGTPVTSVTYADSALSSLDITGAWPFQEIVDSAKFNEFLRRVSSVMKQLEEWGILPWCADVTYAAGARVLGSNDKIYRATAATTGDDPVAAPAGKWTLDNLADHAATAASTTVVGHVELADNTEAQGKADATRALTPANLGALAGSETFAGLLELANAAEAAAGTDTGRALSPGRLAAAFPQSLAANGHITLPGGLMIQWLTVNITSTRSSHALPTPFPNNFFGGVGSYPSLNSVTYPIGVSPNGLSNVYAESETSTPRDCFLICIGN